ncbi:hypothetical protein HDC92_004311 [Pedobacter sp. AK017]|uniref:FecR family protein n=1 Tax=Pedobacter sp. AK017 TaxID=2723073 RepID=UPI00161BE2A5|nr:FecR family protein [Pedobacter sp. AK017]MBB5440608.1 hypothetical protein [Pedobacter sp. AK017]
MSKLHRNQLLDLVGKYLDHTASAEEVELLEAYWKLFDDAPKPLNGINPEQLSDIEDYLKSNIDMGIEAIEKPAVPLFNYRWRKIAIAAAVATVIFGAGLFFYKNQQKTEPAIVAYANDITPGKKGATLTLANGKKIKLSDASNGELAKEAGLTISKSADGQVVYSAASNDGSSKNKINTLTTAKGETYILSLPDKSKVWMNAASSLIYATALNERGERRVKLTGEAYFEISRDKAHPFIVETDKQEIEVLGTHFNVNAYPDEQVVATALAEGSVSITSGKGRHLLKPGQMALNNGIAVKISTADIENITDWKEGDFNLERINFRMAMRKIARWYDVEVIYDDSVPLDLETGGWISRDKNLSGILKFIEKSGLVHFKVEGRKVYVSR